MTARQVSNRSRFMSLLRLVAPAAAFVPLVSAAAPAVAGEHYWDSCPTDVTQEVSSIDDQYLLFATPGYGYASRACWMYNIDLRNISTPYPNTYDLHPYLPSQDVSIDCAKLTATVIASQVVEPGLYEVLGGAEFRGAGDSGACHFVETSTWGQHVSEVQTGAETVRVRVHATYDGSGTRIGVRTIVNDDWAD